MTNDERRWQSHVAAYKVADTLFREGKFKAAVPAFRVALAFCPGDSDTLWALGDCYSESGRPAHPERMFRKAWSNAERHRRGEIIYNIGNALLDQGRPQAALRAFRRVPRYSPAYRAAQRNARIAALKPRPALDGVR